MPSRRAFRRLLIAATDIMHCGHAMTDRVNDRELCAFPVQRVVERVAADRVRGFEDATHRHAIRRTRQRR